MKKNNFKMNSKNTFPINYIKKDRSFFFWAALNAAKTNMDTDPELALKWLNTALNQTQYPSDWTEEENTFEIKEVDVSEQLKFILSDYNDQFG